MRGTIQWMEGVDVHATYCQVWKGEGMGWGRLTEDEETDGCEYADVHRVLQPELLHWCSIFDEEWLEEEAEMH